MRIAETADDIVYERQNDVPIRPMAVERILTCLVDRLVGGEPFKLLSAIVETKSFSKAALALGMTQPSVSQNVKRLETIFGWPLFRRSSKGAELTAHGEAVIMYVRIVQALTEDLQRYFGAVAEDFSMSEPACRSAAFAGLQRSRANALENVPAKGGADSRCRNRSVSPRPPGMTLDMAAPRRRDRRNDDE